ncbi:SDR family NAD(P)-dependent oxidoreductase [Propionibacteriaceae bacterium G57]|uniref:SDR family NAD(P)-dependent oxidoreductase n=1 Tax=Aestuariimicrobium sp. G57 TaxID=3418485 RepID=UPI003DA6E651
MSEATPDMFDLTGETAVVVGAGIGGLGARAAQELSRRGANVVLADHPGRADDLAASAATLAGPCSTATCDVTSEDDVSALMAHAVATFGGLDVVVNCAGAMLRKEFDQTTVEDFERLLRVNTLGNWLLARAAGVQMLAAPPARGGRIVLMSTVYAERVGPIPESAYYASKAGVVNVTRALAQELGPHDVRVNCLAPGVFYPTGMTAALDETPDRLEWFAARTMLGRNGDPDHDFTGPLVFLSTPASSFVTGQVLYVDGGWSAW